MKAGLTIDDLIAAYGPTIRSMPSGKPRDPMERELLRQLGDPTIGREKDELTRHAGERPTNENARGRR
ncbi:hypothetical protein GETHED_25820 [Geothrix edaphica]|uniref:Uncharacterized protein n=1 Tax=Geothrix edaphica TaxID=2927976 RepID=A0ABQ5Q112_9BACT|nr:hypothetical protein GETHED_25820 [Geothrix edaphica]